jgi:hypothetical protein
MKFKIFFATKHTCFVAKRRKASNKGLVLWVTIDFQPSFTLVQPSVSWGNGAEDGCCDLAVDELWRIWVDRL